MSTPTITPPTPGTDDAPPPTAAELINTAVEAWKARLAEIEEQARPLNDEADELRAAIRQHTPREPSRRSTTGRGGRSKSDTRSRILAALGPKAKTARQIADATGIPVGTVSSNLRALTNDGEAIKAAKGYEAKPN